MLALIRHENFSSWYCRTFLFFPPFNFLLRSLSFFLYFIPLYIFSHFHHEANTNIKVDLKFMSFSNFFSSFLLFLVFFFLMYFPTLSIHVYVCRMASTKNNCAVMLWMKNEYVCFYNTHDDDKETGDRMKTLKYITVYHIEWYGKQTIFIYAYV